MTSLQPLSNAWTLDPTVAYLNHGAFGACPKPVLDRQAELRAELEREPMLFLDRSLEGRLDDVRQALAPHLGAEGEDLVFVANATTAVNAVLQSFAFSAGDELLITSQGYNACNNAAQARAAATRAHVVVADVPFPLRDSGQIVDAVLERVTPRTRLALIDHVTSQTGLVFPIQALVEALRARGVATLVDGAHAPGMVPIDLARLGADYYTGNAHKWLCAPKTAAFLWVRRELQAQVRPLVISHGANSARRDRSRYRIEFDWTGTLDPTPLLCIPAALAFLGQLLPGGLPALAARNRALALAGRALLAERLALDLPAPDDLIGSLAALPLGHAPHETPDPLQAALFDRYRIEVPIFPWPALGHRVLRISAQAYNGLAQYQTLADALAQLLPGVTRGD